MGKDFREENQPKSIHKKEEIQTRPREERQNENTEQKFAIGAFDMEQEKLDSHIDVEERYQMHLDTGMYSFISIARFHGIAIEPEQVAHILALEKNMTAEDILIIAKKADLKAKIANLELKYIESLPKPAIVELNNGEFCLLAHVDSKQALILRQGDSAPVSVPIVEFEKQFSGNIILIAQKFWKDKHRAFGFRWFIPDIIKYKKPLGEEIEEKIKEYNLDQETQNNLILLAKYRDSDFEGQKNILDLISKQNEEQVAIRENELVRMKNELTALQKREENLRVLAHSKGEIEIGLKAAEERVRALRKEEQVAAELYQAGGLSKSEWEQIQHQLEIAQNTYEAEQCKAELEKINRQMSWENAKAEIQDKQNEIQLQQIRIEQERIKHEESLSNRDNLDIKKNESILDLLVQKEKFLLDVENQIEKVQKSIDLFSLKSPIDGTVHGLSTNTVGGVVTLAQPIMTIVPDGTPLLVEASLQNKDVGFVHIGQQVEVKVDAFPYQRYGMVEGIVQSVSPDAFEDEKLGLIYRVKVALENPTVIVDGKEQRLSAGMSVSAEIKTGRRRIISFFLEPFVKNVKESITLR